MSSRRNRKVNKIVKKVAHLCYTLFNMMITLDQAQLSALQLKNKIYSYLGSSLTKTYMSVGDNSFILFFKGIRGALKTTIQIDAPSPALLFQVDYGKWTNALGKMTFAKEICIEVTNKHLRISSSKESNDIISLGITTYPPSSSEELTLKSFVETARDQLSSMMKFEYTDTLGGTLLLTNMMFSATGNNNSIELSDGKVTYADRSIVLQSHVDELNAVTKPVLVHKYLIGLLNIVSRFSRQFYYDPKTQTMFWDDGTDTMFVFASEPCEIQIPTEEDLEQNIRPKRPHFAEIDSQQLFNALNFFEGFYEGTVWKPLTFETREDNFQLWYRHPSTEINKLIDPIKHNAEGETFTIASEMLERIVSRAIEEDVKVIRFEFDEEGPGVRVIAGRFDAVLGKLKI